MKRREFIAAAVVPCALAVSPASAQEDATYDVVLKGGHVIDVRNGVNQQMDVAVQGGKIARVDRNIPATAGKSTINRFRLLCNPRLNRSAYLLLLHQP